MSETTGIVCFFEIRWFLLLTDRNGAPGCRDFSLHNCNGQLVVVYVPYFVYSVMERFESTVLVLCSG